MLVEFLPPSPKAGKQEHVAHDVGNALIVSGFAKLVPPPPPKIEPPSFAVHKGFMHGDVSLLFHCPSCSLRTHFGGKDLAKINASLCSHGKAAGGVPQDVWKKYMACGPTDPRFLTASAVAKAKADFAAEHPQGVVPVGFDD